MALPSFLKRGWVWLLLLAALLAVGFQLPGWLWGPKAPMYAVSSGPMLKNVVATGRVMTTARYEIASEIVGTVVERLVSDGEPVAAGQLVVKLDPREAQARVAQNPGRAQPAGPRAAPGGAGRFAGGAGAPVANRA